MISTRSRFDTIVGLATIMLGLSSVALTGIVGYRQFHPRSPGNGPVKRDRQLSDSDWAVAKAGGHSTGPAAAQVTIVEFTDFQCPYCRKFFPVIHGVMVRHPEVRVLTRHLPLSIHANAYFAARTAECAGTQGAFDVLSPMLYDRADSLGSVRLDRLGTTGGVTNIPAFLACAKSDGPVQSVEGDIAAAHSLGLRSTPSIIFNGLVLGNTPDSASFERMIKGVEGNGRRLVRR